MSQITCKTGETVESYADYLNTVHWSTTRRKVRTKYKNACAACRWTAKEEQMHVHHLTYERIGKERMTDLVLLCASCHVHVHSWMETMKGDDLGKHAFDVVRKSFQIKGRGRPIKAKKTRKKRRKRG